MWYWQWLGYGENLIKNGLTVSGCRREVMWWVGSPRARTGCLALLVAIISHQLRDQRSSGMRVPSLTYFLSTRHTSYSGTKPPTHDFWGRRADLSRLWHPGLVSRETAIREMPDVHESRGSDLGTEGGHSKSKFWESRTPGVYGRKQHREVCRLRSSLDSVFECNPTQSLCLSSGLQHLGLYIHSSHTGFVTSDTSTSTPWSWVPSVI